MTTKTGEYLQRICLECNGEGRISACCQDYVDDNNRCGCCGRFTKPDFCCECNGEGILTYGVGDEVDIFVCVWSPEYLKDMLYKPKKVGDTKSYQGTVTQILDDHCVEVRIPVKRKKFKICIEELEVR